MLKSRSHSLPPETTETLKLTWSLLAGSRGPLASLACERRA